ncbi:MAG: Fic family protein [Gemmatimonadales bacterium]
MISIEAVRVSPDILRLIAELDEFKGAWRALGRLAPERLSTLKRVATIESIGSSTRIEGSKLSDREIEALLSTLETTSFATRDEQEVAGYATAMELVFSSWNELRLTENHIRQLHRDLLCYSDKDARHRGQYKTMPNSVAAFDREGRQLGVIFETTSPFDTPQRMTDLTAWFNGDDGNRLHPLLRIGLWVVLFLAIHPFQDGNGRLSRVLTTLLLLQAGYAYVPYSSLESVIEHNKEGYYLALRRTQRTVWSDAPDWQPWLLFFLQALAEQARRLHRRIEHEELLAVLPEQSLRIIELARERGRVTMGDVIALTGGNRNTLKLHFRTLVEQGRLRRHGRGRGVWYQLQ